MTDTDLLPCPFCGCAGETISSLTGFVTVCTECSFRHSVEMFGKTIEQSVEAWNTRTPSSTRANERGDAEPIKKGAYVLATKYSDGDPQDWWCVGMYDRFEDGRHHVIDSEGKTLKPNGFRRAGMIESEFGALLIEHKDTLHNVVGSLWDSQRTIEAVLQHTPQPSPQSDMVAVPMGVIEKAARVLKVYADGRETALTSLTADSAHLALQPYTKLATPLSSGSCKRILPDTENV